MSSVQAGPSSPKTPKQRSKDLHLFILLGTGQDPDSPKPSIQCMLPILLHRLLKSQGGHWEYPEHRWNSPIVRGGVGVSRNKALRGTGAHYHNWIMNKIDAFTGGSMDERMKALWECTGIVKSGDKVVFIGCSRGGYMVLKMNNNTRLRFKGSDENRNGTPTAHVQRFVYALDPVPGKSVPQIAYNSENIRLCSFLMEDEDRKYYKPYEHQLEGGNFTQLWSPGYHGDAWGPSQKAIPIMAYLLNDLQSQTNATPDIRTGIVDLLGNSDVGEAWRTDERHYHGKLNKLLGWWGRRWGQRRHGGDRVQVPTVDPLLQNIRQAIGLAQT